MPLLFASTNPGKLKEVREILAPFGIEVRGLHELGTDLDEPEEDGATFEENARIKARAYAAQSGLRCLADDSGLEVDALDGAPGVHSARYAGASGDRETRDRENNRRLLRELDERRDQPRTARFVCVMCVCEPNGQLVCEARGEFPGVIAEEPAGTNGFGYDPLLWIEELGCTAAQLSSEEKNARSHRGAACRQVARRLGSG